MDRVPRMPLAQAGFDKLEMPIVELDPETWVNLRFRQYATQGDLFVARAGARLTPASMKVPCLYLAKEMSTAYMELYGDKHYAAKEEGTPLIITETELEERVFINVQTRKVKLCDLVKPGAAKKLNLDQGTIWAADLKYPRSFAEAIHKHPAAVDGILYMSRHTDMVCAVVWNRAAARLITGSEVSLRTCLKATGLIDCSLFGERVLVAGTSETLDRVADSKLPDD